MGERGRENHTVKENVRMRMREIKRNRVSEQTDRETETECMGRDNGDFNILTSRIHYYLCAPGEDMDTNGEQAK